MPGFLGGRGRASRWLGAGLGHGSTRVWENVGGVPEPSGGHTEPRGLGPGPPSGELPGATPVSAGLGTPSALVLSRSSTGLPEIHGGFSGGSLAPAAARGRDGGLDTGLWPPHCCVSLGEPVGLSGDS